MSFAEQIKQREGETAQEWLARLERYSAQRADFHLWAFTVREAERTIQDEADLAARRAAQPALESPVVERDVNFRLPYERLALMALGAVLVLYGAALWMRVIIVWLQSFPTGS